MKTQRPRRERRAGRRSVRPPGPRAQVAPLAIFRRTALRVVLTCLALAGVILAGTLVRAWISPGSDGLAARTVEWARDMGGTRIVNWAEHVWYSHHRPPAGGKPSRGLSSHTAADAPAPITPIANPPLAGEGVWHAAGRRNAGRPVLWTTALRPDNVHTSLLTGVARMDASALRFVMYQGTRVPGGGPWHVQAPIPDAERPKLVAAFNSGFRLSESRGGYFAEGRYAGPLVEGAASFVITKDGRATVGQWGRDVTMSRDIVGVRQNLELIVDNRTPVPGLNSNSRGRWGYTLGNKVLVWRSGIGVSRDGSLLFAAGPGLSVRTLANVLVAAGAVRAMELDINYSWTDFFIYNSLSANPGETVATKLLPEMHGSVNRYFRVSSKDFIAAFLP